MALSEHFASEDLHPIDIVEHLAEHHDWEFDRIGEDQIAMAVEGQWRTYSITLAWSDHDDMLRIVCTFEMEPPLDRVGVLHEGLNAINDQCWAGSFSYWGKEQLMVFKYGLLLSGDTIASPDQIDRMITLAVANAERYYPAFQLMCWTDKTPDQALQIAIAEAYGRA